MLIHSIKPVFTAESDILILGSFPSVKSRETGFYYGHPQNRFWKVLSSVLENPVPETVEQKKTLLMQNKIALWDVVGSCDIEGSSDSSIKNVTANDIGKLVGKTQITRVFTNGKKADALYRKYVEAEVGLSACCLPSTSPANAAWTLERLCSEWKKINLTP